MELSSEDQAIDYYLKKLEDELQDLKDMKEKIFFSSEETKDYISIQLSQAEDNLRNCTHRMTYYK